MRTSDRPSYAGYRFTAGIISHAVRLCFRFPLSLRRVDEPLAARGITASHETVRQRARKFGQPFANRIRRRLPRAGDEWHLDEVAVKIAGVKHRLRRAVDQTGLVLDVLVQSAVGTPGPPGVFCASCSSGNAGHRGSWSPTSWPAAAWRRAR